ncbi:uncharacterized protein LOC114538272 [Dendronephthya gigantea]|uniref:uncharacterized protein LOC114538272 n=1 Tax=Dendronephthya gigantea TaxID=151771 RepID=UPI00106BED92|nr:uncharacterized protein LOC114538272 [Dendronephthya gigantea]
MEAMLQNRFEGSIFFVYDRHFLQKEEDLLEDAIIYFYPHSMPIDNQCRLCGQLMGLVQFTDSVFGSCPALFRFDNEKIAVKHVGKYSLALAGNSFEPDSALLATVDRLYFLFAFYHGSINQVELECDNDREKFIPEIHVIWEQYLAFIRNYGDNLPSVFNPIPYLPLKNDLNFYFLKASHILESCQRRPQIIAGAILYNRFILCSHLTDPITRCLLLLKPNQEHHPAMPIETGYQLPFGVRLFNVYLTRNDLTEILVNNENSPYQSPSEEPFRCCCSENKTPRSRTPRMHIRKVGSTTPQPKVELTQSEKDPLHSSDNSSSKLCKAMLEDLLLKGFRCCKCIEETDGELEEGSSFGDESVSECKENKRSQENALIPSTEDRNCNNIEEAIEECSRNSADSSQPQLSQNSVVEAESGIEVTGSDFHSSAATNLDQPSASFSYVKYQEKSRNFTLCCKTEETDKIASHLEGKHDIRGEQNDLEYADKEPTKHSSNNELTNRDYDITNLPQNEQKDEDNTSYDSDHVTAGEEVRESFGKAHANADDVNPTVSEDEETERLKYDQLSKACNTGKENDFMERRKLSNSIDVDSSLKNHVLGEEQDGVIEKQSTDCMPREVTNQRLNALTLEEPYQLSSSEDSYRTPDEILDTEEPLDGLDGMYDTEEELCEGQWMNNEDIDALLDEDEEGLVHVCKLGMNRDIECQDVDERQDEEYSNKCQQNECHGQFCEVDGLIHANLFVQAHSEIVLILLAKCDLYQNEDTVKSLWSSSLSQLGELDILMKNSAKHIYQDAQVPFNLLIYDNFEKTMSGNLREPVFAPDHVFCEAAKTLHSHFKNAPQLGDVTLRNFLCGIYGERTLSRETYFQESVNNSSSNWAPNITGYLAEKMREYIVKDGLPFV